MSKYTPKNVPRELRIAVYQRDNFECQLRLPGCTWTPTELDHIIPASQGGTHTLENYRASCGNCNRRRGAPKVGPMNVDPPEWLL